MPYEINVTGPKCTNCGARPDDPVYTYDDRFVKAIHCLGCVADARTAGRRLVVTRRVSFQRTPWSLS